MESFALFIGIFLGCMLTVGAQITHHGEQMRVCQILYRASECEKIYVPVIKKEEEATQ